MADAPKVNWPGGSGLRYAYNVHDLDWIPAANQDGNYVFARPAGTGWEAVYIGQGDLQTRRAAHLDDRCVIDKGSTHFHCHLKSSQSARLAEEADMLLGNTEAYQPTGCNERPGG